MHDDSTLEHHDPQVWGTLGYAVMWDGAGF